MADWDRKTPWRQGLFLPDEMIAALGLEYKDTQDDTIVIVASHDCDIAQHPDNEPEIEVIVGHAIDSMDGNYTHAKTSRTLHIRIADGDNDFAEFSITQKKSIPKEVFSNFEPLEEANLSPADKTTFQRWLSSRYRRSAFPDEFERRLVHETKLAKKIAKAVKPLGEQIILVLFDVDEGDEYTRHGPNDTYTLDITLLYSTSTDALKAEEAAQEAMNSIRNAFEKKLFDKDTGKWHQIELRYSDVISEEALTYHQYSLMKPWRLEHISLGAEPQQRISTE